MTQRRENAKETAVGCLVIVGILVFVIGLIGSFTFWSAGTYHATFTRDPNTGQVNSVGAGAFLPLGVGVMVLGVLISAAGVGWGWFIHKRRNSGPMREYEGALVMSRFAYGKAFNYLSEWEYDDPHAKFYVRMQIDPVNVLEFETSRPVFEACGEGMRGTAKVQGKWLGSFLGYQGVGIYEQDDRTFDPRQG